jgi:hypothetical protein
MMRLSPPGDAEREVLNDLVDRLKIPRVFITPETGLDTALALLLGAIVDRLEALERGGESR